MKKKKITIKPFLNTYLDAVGSETSKKGTKDIYSLYYKVTYDRKNTQLKSYYSLGFSNLEDTSAKEVIAFETKILTSIIDYEVNLHPDKEYQVSGLKKKYEVYVLSVYQVMDKYLRQKLQRATLKTNNPWQLALNFNSPSIMINSMVLLEMCRTLFKDFDKYLDKEFKEELESFKHYHQSYSHKQLEYDFATLIDWKNGTHQKELETVLQKQLKQGPKKIEKYMKIMDQMQETRLKNVITE